MIIPGIPTFIRPYHFGFCLPQKVNSYNIVIIFLPHELISPYTRDYVFVGGGDFIKVAIRCLCLP